MPVADGSAVRVGRHVTIRPVHPNDYRPLFEMALYTDAGSRWRLHGEVPTEEKFLQLLLNDARATFVIETGSGRRLIGMVQLWMHDVTSRNAHITAFLDPSARGRGWPLEGIILFVDYVFKAFGLHKLYFESLDDEYKMYGSMVGTILREEGVLRQHKWLFGEWSDFHILALYDHDVPKLTRLLRPATDEPRPTEVPPGIDIEADLDVAVVTVTAEGP